MADKPKWIFTDTFPVPLLRVVAQITMAAGQLEYALLLAYKRASGKGMKAGILGAEELRTVKLLSKEIKKAFNEQVTDTKARKIAAAAAGPSGRVAIWSGE